MEKFLHMTDFSSYLPFEDNLPTDNLSSGDFLHMTICHVDTFLHMADFFSTSIACGACDKYQICDHDDDDDDDDNDDDDQSNILPQLW